MSQHPTIPELPAPEESGRIAYLIAQFLQNQLTPNERRELDDWVSASDENLALFEELTDEKNINQSIIWMKQFDVNLAKKRVHQKLGLKPHKPLWITILPYAVAASILVVAGMGWYHYREARTGNPPAAMVVQPAQPKAILQLAGGGKIDLGKDENKIVATGAGYRIEQQGDLLVVRPGTGEGSPLYHSLYTPRGAKYTIQLMDGSKVWLNADTKLRFQVSAPGKERLVELEGEAYFEVAHKPEQPFLVNLDGARIKVLGTHFNVRSYRGDALKTTLLEGSVEISNAAHQQRLRPGQEATLQEKNGPIAVSEGDPEAAIGWQKGWFVFRDSPIEAIMNEVARWYNVEVQYTQPVTQHFNGSFARDVSLSKLLGYLEGTGGVHFQIKNRQVIVAP